MNNDIKKARDSKAAQGNLSLTTGLLPMLLGIAALGSAPGVLAVDECGAGPMVTCTATTYASTGITYNFSADLDILMEAPNAGNQGVGATGIKLNGTGNADLRLKTSGIVWGAGGIRVNMGDGDFIGDIGNQIAATPTNTAAAGGVGLQVSTGGAATIVLRGQPSTTTSVNAKLTNLVLDIGKDSTVEVLAKRTVQAMTLSPRAGATLTINNAGVLGFDNTHLPSANLLIGGAGAGNLVLNNALVRGRINGRMDFTGMTGELTILNDYSGNARQGGWHTIGTSLFGSGIVDIRNGRNGVLRTRNDTAFDFSNTQDSSFFNSGRVMVAEGSDGHLRFIGLDRFENAGLILLGTSFESVEAKGFVTDGTARDRLSFEDSHYVGAEGGVIAFDATLGRTPQVDCSTGEVADCVRFTGSSTTDGVTLLNVRDLDPSRAAAGFNPGIVLVEGASAAEHFVLDPTTQFYVANTSSGAALQKGMVAYRLLYDADTRQHALVGTLADEAAQAATLGAAAHEIWRHSSDTWFDRQVEIRDTQARGFAPQAAWGVLSTSRGDRSLQRTVNVAGSPAEFNLNQDQDVSHLAFGLDLLRVRSGAQSWGGGVTVGLLDASTDYEATGTQTTMTGLASGLYGSWAMGGLTVDGLFNVNYLRQSLKGTNFGLGDHNRLRSQVKSNGGRVEAGWKLAMNDSFWLQPLLGASYVTTSEGDITLPDNAGGVRFGNDDRSFRVGAGLRAGVDSRLAGLRAQYRLTGRYWNEREAENTVMVDVSGELPLALGDDFTGGFSEVDGSVSLSNEAGSLTGYLGVKSKFGDDYSSVGGSAGVRYYW